jgi:GDP-L-fucose synthase
VVHLAATCGGIGANEKSPARFIYDNVIMGANVIQCCSMFGVGKVVLIGSVCSYPKFTPVPFNEDDLWNGDPEETNAPYGIAKRMLLEQATAYAKDYGLRFNYLIPANMYGPGDHFDRRKSHVIPAIISAMIEAREKNMGSVTLWGDGSATRDFLYVSDFAKLVLDVAIGQEYHQPVNVGTGEETSILQIANMIKSMVGYGGEILWDKSMPNGQPRRALDISRAKTVYGFYPQTDLVSGLLETIRWYEKHEEDNGRK